MKRTGNSARSIMAEVLLNRLGQERFRAFSAGSHPTGQVHPLAIEQLERARLPTEVLRSKDWNEFAKPGAQRLDFALLFATRQPVRSVRYGRGSR